MRFWNKLFQFYPRERGMTAASLLMNPLIKIFHSALQYHGGNIHIFGHHGTLVIAEMGYHTPASAGSFGKESLRPFTLFE